MRVGEVVERPHDRHCRDAGLLEVGSGGVLVAIAGPGGEAFVDLVDPRQACLGGGQARVGLPTTGGLQPPPRVVIGDGDRNPCVVTIGRVDAMGGLVRVSIPEIDRIDARLDRSEVLLTQEIDGRFRLGQFDKLALASAFSMVEGGEHCGGEHLAGDVIGMVHGRAGRIRTVGVAPQQVDAGKSGVEWSVGLLVAHRTTAPVALRRGVDQFGLLGA